MPGIITNDDWIARLAPTVKEAMESRMATLSVQAGVEFTHAGEPPSAIYRVVTGYLRLIALQEDGRHVLITIYGPGACFAETALISKRPLNHTTIALTDATVSALKEAEFWLLYRLHREMADALTLKFASVISTQILHREARATLRISKRIVDMFGELASACGRPQRDGMVEIPLPLTQTDIAEHFDVTRQTIHRELSELRANKLIMKQGSGWLVANPVRLAAFS